MGRWSAPREPCELPGIVGVPETYSIEVVKRRPTDRCNSL